MTCSSMIFKREIGEKGQVVIPIDIRKLLDLQRGSELVFEVVNKEVKLKKENSKKTLEKFFTIARTKGKDLSSIELEKINDESYDLP